MTSGRCAFIVIINVVAHWRGAYYW